MKRTIKITMRFYDETEGETRTYEINKELFFLNEEAIPREVEFEWDFVDAE